MGGKFEISRKLLIALLVKKLIYNDFNNKIGFINFLLFRKA